MYEEITGQPDVVERSLQLAASHGPAVASLLAGARRIFATGCGTSFHAALLTAWMLRSLSRGKVDARAIESFELASYLPGLRPDDVVIGVTHSGTTTMTLRALERARRSGCESVAITGFPESTAGQLARHVLPTGFPVERSWAHTASYTAALTVAAAVANMLAEREERLDLSPLPELMRTVLSIEEMAHRLAAGVILGERYREVSDIVLIGGGPNAVTASEGVLKLLETSYVRASAFELEEMLHGPLAAVSPDVVVMVIAPSGGAIDRAVELTHALQAIEVTPVVLTDDSHAESFDESHRLVLPDVPEVISPIPFVVPIQLFAYFLAVGRGLNPDLLHRDDERYRKARAQYR
jgi:glucosamine--fructose-6-phosphate aminotransferase (isomerizing)